MAVDGHGRKTGRHVSVSNDTVADLAPAEPVRLRSVAVHPLRWIPGAFGTWRSRPEAVLTRVEISGQWVYATTGLQTTYHWHRHGAFFDVDIDRRTIAVAARGEEHRMTAAFFTRSQLRFLHSAL